MIDIEEIKALVKREIDRRRDELVELSLRIHANPELGFQETKAAGWLTGYLADNGFSVETGVSGLATAFRASYGCGPPVIAFLAEYDALPGLGHACGHNIIAAGAAGAGVASKLAVDRLGGTVVVFGTPAEELFGGKAIMVGKGAFSGIDAAMMVHPGIYNTAVTRALACQNLDIEFFGRPAHAAAQPEAGINALEAMILAYNAIDSLRQHIRDKARIHGIITDGGQAANIVPAHSAASFIVRAEDNDYLEELKPRVLNCFAGAATATGARLEYRWDKVRYEALRSNPTLARLFRENLESLGRKVSLADPNSAFGSTDMGNVSQVLPAIHPEVAIAPVGVAGHSPEFQQAAASEAGMAGLADAAKAMALTLVDLSADPAVLRRVKEEFRSVD
jgi:amidohydrolase